MGEQREQEWRRSGIPESDILASRATGMHAGDVRVFREFSQQGFLIVVRCPKLSARPWHGVLPPKIMAVKDKTGSSGVVICAKGAFVSDYDLMSVWCRDGTGWRKLFISAADGAARGPWSAAARELVKAMNQKLVSRVQHGCQDDFQSPDNPGVKSPGHFAGFVGNQVKILPSVRECREFYRLHGLSWPYDDSGRYTGPGA
jgi:hypothetical protein